MCVLLRLLQWSQGHNAGPCELMALVLVLLVGAPEKEMAGVSGFLNINVALFCE